MVLAGDPVLFGMVRLSLAVSLSAALFAALLGVPLGGLIALTEFRGRELVVVVLNALMGLPPVGGGAVSLPDALALRAASVVGPVARSNGDRTNGAGDADPRLRLQSPHSELNFQPAAVIGTTRARFCFSGAGATMPCLTQEAMTNVFRVVCRARTHGI